MPPAPSARMRARHWGILISFILVVVLPTAAVVWYLETRAADQYASIVGFAVRQEESSPAADILGGLSQLSGNKSSDADILYEYIQSQEMVAKIDAELDLRRIWTKAENDPVFSFGGLDGDTSLEALVSYWNRMVNVFYDGATGLIQIRVLAFDPEDARAIAEAITRESTRKINELNAKAREDATRYAREDLEKAIRRLKGARQAITAFRAREQIVDPNADIQSQMGLLGTLQQQLAQALIELDLLRENTRPNDPRITQLERKIEVIRSHIAEERRKFGLGSSEAGGGPDGTDGERAYAKVVSEYEGLIVEREFAEKTYLNALAAFEAAKAKAQRQSRYLATYIGPTLAQSAEYPRKLLISGLVALFLFLAWTIGVLVYYSIRDRR